MVALAGAVLPGTAVLSRQNGGGGRGRGATQRPGVRGRRFAAAVERRHARDSMGQAAANLNNPVNALCGAVERLATDHGRTAPRQRRMIVLLQRPARPLDDPAPLVATLGNRAILRSD